MEEKEGDDVRTRGGTGNAVFQTTGWMHTSIHNSCGCPYKNCTISHQAEFQPGGRKASEGSVLLEERSAVDGS